MGSINGIQGLPNLVAYAAAKGGLLSMTRTLAGALATDRNSRQTTFIPGWIATEGELKIQKGEGRGIEDLEKAGKRLPFGRMQTVEDTAYAAIYLLSDESPGHRRRPQRRRRRLHAPHSKRPVPGVTVPFE